MITKIKSKNGILAAAFALMALAACNSDEEITQGLPPEIALGNETGVYTVKTGRKLTIAPEYRNAAGASYRWALDGEVCSEEPAYTFHAGAVGSHDLDLRVVTAAGSATEQMRIDVNALALPYITLPGAAEGFTLLPGVEITFSPVVAETLPVTYRWTVDGSQAAATRAFTFSRTERGEYALRLTAENEDGSQQIDFKVRVCSEEDLPFGWTFDRTGYSTTAGRTIRIAPSELRGAEGAEFAWTLDGKEVQRGTESSCLFRAETGITAAATHTLEAAMTKNGQTLTQQLTVTVNPPKEGYRPVTSTSRTECSAVYSFLPGAGQFVNEGYDVTSMKEACAHALTSLGNANAYLSLGAFGGEVVVGFDHSIDNTGDYDLAVLGNPFDGSSEPGIVWVMQDENGNGLPDDTWYELKGSEWGSDQVIRDYAVTYYRPSGPGTDVPWRDNRGGQGVISRLCCHTQDYYYPLWAGAEYTLRGTLLPDNAYDRNAGTDGGEYWILPGFAWGYADNRSSTGYDPKHGNLFRIGDAVDYEGRPAGLEYIDFVKIQTAQMAQHGQIGEVSTDVFAIRDYHLTAGKK